MQAPHHIILTGLATLILIAALAAAANCGGTTTCACGDTVSSDYLLPANLGPCSGHGLVIGDSVKIDGQGFTLSGPGTGTDFAGIYFNGSDDSAVSHLTVTGFRHNARFVDATYSRLTDSTLTNAEGSGTARCVQVGGTTNNSLISHNICDGSDDEGIHLGDGSDRNFVTHNTIQNCTEEELYILSTGQNAIVHNTIHGAVFVKESDENHFVHNTINGGMTFRDSSNNKSTHDTVNDGQVRFQAVSFSADSNVLTKLDVDNADGTCVRSDGSTNNEVKNSVFADCDIDAACTVSGTLYLKNNTGDDVTDDDGNCSVSIQ